MRRVVLLFVLMLGCAIVAQSQRSATINNYNEALGFYNPAAAGRSGKLDVMALYRLQWVGFDDAPKTLFVTAGMPFKFMKREHGVGIALSKDDESAITSSMSVGLQYAYLKKIGKGTLRVGFQVGMINLTENGEKVVLVGDSIGGGSVGGTDEAIPTSKVSSKVFDSNVGLYYGTDRLYVGVGAMHLLEPEIDDENLSTFYEREYNFLAGYNIQTRNPLIELQPSVFLKTNFNMYQADITAKAVFMKKYSGGLSWRMSENSFNEALVVMLGATFGKIQAGYAYDYQMSAVRRASMGSHELYLRYSLQLNKPKTGKSKHKSVRIL